MSDFQATDTQSANKMVMGFAKKVGGKRGGKGGAPTAAEAYSSNFAPAGAGNVEIDAFAAQWGLDAQAQRALSSLDPGAQQRLMSDFQATDTQSANKMVMGFAKKVGGKRGGKGGAPTAAEAYSSNFAPAGTGNVEIDGFVAQWGLDSKAQQTLCTLDPELQQRVMSGFHPTDMSRANQMFMGFVKSLSGKGGRFTPY